MVKANVSEFFYCYSPALNKHLLAKGLRYLGTGLNENSGKKFWQYRRGDELDSAISEWQANRPVRR